VQAPRRRGDGGIFLPEPEMKKGAMRCSLSLPASSVCIMQHSDTPMPRASHRARNAGATSSQRSAQRRGFGIFGTWPCARVVGSLDSSMFEAAKHRRAAPSHKATGAGAVAASNRHHMNHDSLGLVFL